MFESGARAHPPQEVYRAYLAQSDIFLGIYWQRYGLGRAGHDDFRTGGRTAARRGMPRLLYVKVPAPGTEPGLHRMLESVRAEGASAYKKFTGATAAAGAHSW